MIFIDNEETATRVESLFSIHKITALLNDDSLKKELNEILAAYSKFSDKKINCSTCRNDIYNTLIEFKKFFSKNNSILQQPKIKIMATRKYFFKDGKSFRFQSGAIVYTNANLTDEIAEMIIKKFPHLENKLFHKLEVEETATEQKVEETKVEETATVTQKKATVSKSEKKVEKPEIKTETAEQKNQETATVTQTETNETK